MALLLKPNHEQLTAVPTNRDYFTNKDIITFLDIEKCLVCGTYHVSNLSLVDGRGIDIGNPVGEDVYHVLVDNHSMLVAATPVIEAIMDTEVPNNLQQLLDKSTLIGPALVMSVQEHPKYQNALDELRTASALALTVLGDTPLTDLPVLSATGYNDIASTILVKAMETPKTCPSFAALLAFIGRNADEVNARSYTDRFTIVSIMTKLMRS